MLALCFELIIVTASILEVADNFLGGATVGPEDAR